MGGQRLLAQGQPPANGQHRRRGQNPRAAPGLRSRGRRRVQHGLPSIQGHRLPSLVSTQAGHHPALEARDARRLIAQIAQKEDSLSIHAKTQGRAPRIAGEALDALPVGLEAALPEPTVRGVDDQIGADGDHQVSLGGPADRRGHARRGQRQLTGGLPVEAIHLAPRGRHGEAALRRPGHVQPVGEQDAGLELGLGVEVEPLLPSHDTHAGGAQRQGPCRVGGLALGEERARPVQPAECALGGEDDDPLGRQAQADDGRGALERPLRRASVVAKGEAGAGGAEHGVGVEVDGGHSRLLVWLRHPPWRPADPHST